MSLPAELLVLFCKTRNVYLNIFFFFFVSFRGHGILNRHSIKRNMGEAENCTILRSHRERKDGGEFSFCSVNPGIENVLENIFVATKPKDSKIKEDWDVIMLENKSI